MQFKFSQGGGKCTSEFLNMWNFKCLKLIIDDSLCSESGKLLHAHGAATAKAHSPMVEQCVHGTTSCQVDEDLSLCLDSETSWRSSDRYYGSDALSQELGHCGSRVTSQYLTTPVEMSKYHQSVAVLWIS